jgi:hypothetical protein
MSGDWDIGDDSGVDAEDALWGEPTAADYSREECPCRNPLADGAPGPLGHTYDDHTGFAENGLL